MKNKLLLIALFIFSILTLIFTLSASAAVVKFGDCGENLTYVLDDSGTLTITGTGEMTDWSYPDCLMPWYSKEELIKEIVFSDGITHIGNEAFE